MTVTLGIVSQVAHRMLYGTLTELHRPDIQKFSISIVLLGCVRVNTIKLTFDEPQSISSVLCLIFKEIAFFEDLCELFSHL